MNHVRHQITLFLPEPTAGLVDAIRALVDPVQAALIPAHVTLVRDDELPDMSAEMFVERFETTQPHDAALNLSFGPPCPSVNHGVLMPCTSDLTVFQALRCRLYRELQSTSLNAHLTLAHPRNPKASGNTPENLRPLAGGLSIQFHQLALIQQTNSQPWVILKTIALS